MPRTTKPQSVDAQMVLLLQQLIAAVGLLRDMPADIRQLRTELHAVQQQIAKLQVASVKPALSQE